MAGALPPVVAELLASNSDFMAKMAESKAAMEDVSKSGTSSFSKLSTAGGAILGGVAIAAVAVGAASVKMGADFQRSMTLLVTGAGESQKNIKMVSDGILNMAGAVGQTPQQLAAGMFLIESAGYHGAAGLKVLKSAAEGAATGGAQMSTVANALTTAMHDYNIPTDRANAVTSALVQTVADGKTHLEDLAGSLGKVMPQAAALGVSFADVTGAMATMTNAGLTARLASMHLNNTLLAMSAPSATAVKAMQGVGLSSQQVKNALDGPGGLHSALQLIEQHVSQTFPAGSVASVNAFKTIMGGATGYSTALMLTGANSKTFEADVQSIGDKLNGSASSVQGFAATQKDLSFQLDQARATAEALGTKLGLVLIPVLETVAHDAMDVVNWFQKNADVAYALAAAFGAIATVAVTAFAIDKISNWVSTIQGAIKWVTGLGTAADVTSGELDTMAASETLAGDSAAGMGAAGAAKTGVTAAEGAAGAGAAGAGEAAGGVALASSSTVVAAAVVTAVPLVMGVLGLIRTGNQPYGGLSEKQREAADKRQGFPTVGMGGLVSPLDLSKPITSGPLITPQLIAAMGGAHVAPSGGPVPGMKSDLAKDATLQAQMAVLAQMKGQLAADTAKYGASSVQAHQDAAALATTANKWGADQGLSLKGINSQMSNEFLALLALKSDQAKLETSGAGNLQQSKYIKAVLDNQLDTAKTTLSKDETAKASKQAIDQAKQKVADAETAVKNVQSHIDQLKAIADQITKTQDTFNANEKLVGVMSKVNSDTSALKTETSNIGKVLGKGIPITKLPDTQSKVAGTITLKVG